MIAPSGQVKIEPNGSGEFEGLSLGARKASCFRVGVQSWARISRWIAGNRTWSAPGGKAAECVFRGLQEDFNATGFRKLIWLSLVNPKVVYLHNMKKVLSVDQKRSSFLATLLRPVF
jgi:hypothetical protein